MGNNCLPSIKVHIFDAWSTPPSNSQEVMSSVFESPICIPDLTDQIIKYSDKPAAAGGYAKIFKCSWNSPSESSPVAVQVIKVQHDSDSLSEKGEELRREIKLDLTTSLRAMNVFAWWLQDIASALQYLHSFAVVHGNLSGHNILVDSNGRAFVKGSGLSTMLDEIAESESYETRLGDVAWTAPELMVDSSSGLPTSQSDVWSFGCNMIHVLSGQEPWQKAPDDTVKARLRDDQVPVFPEGISAQDLSFLRRCFSLRPADRPSADQILTFVHEESLRCMPGIPQTVEVTVSEHGSPYGIPDVMIEFKRRVFDQVPSHLIYIPEMKLISREELLTILEPEKITEEDISKHEGWSRKWGKSEPTFQDLKSGKREGAGYEKLRSFCTKAKETLWLPSCMPYVRCTDGTRGAYICIVHLAQSESLETLGIDEWFLRGWTLQELLAPLRMKFYGPRWTPLTDNENDKDDAAVVSALSRVTKIPLNDLCNFSPGPNRAWEKMTWAASRKTTRIEDVAYSLTGIFDISMTIAYGEGDRAFKRFMAELIQNCKEWQILVWAGGLPGCPTEPGCYRTTNATALDMLKNRQISWWGEGCGDSDFSITKRGVHVRLLMLPASVSQSQWQSTFLSRPAGRRWVSPLKKLVVQSHFFPPASTTEWMVGIINYHDHDDPDKGILKRGESYICFLLKRFRRPGMDTVRNHWRRQITEEILTVSCANDFEKMLESVWL
ncbi:kinase-like domain-containing protein [Suillus subalutaceus]|uniref:kinase-like domain-containing protein n=1 Tax=Suillus subalutaceus TaxID=48586 RepID=UPI001B88609A|nr:kinase-like domain-containing protein [Suillus subalutaceus]KAG1843279.1 kinase-like domain-containing protein [Suillus subalutaceus]